MPEESRIKRWRANKREQGLKHVSVWLKPEAELRLKDLALQSRCSVSDIVARALAQFPTPVPDNSSPTDTSQIRRLILAELEALGMALPAVKGSDTVGSTADPTDTQAPTAPVKARQARRYTAEPGHSLVTEPQATPKRGDMRARIQALLVEHPGGLTAQEIRVYLKAEKPLGDTLQGMTRQHKVRTEGSGKALRYFALQ
jgi:hypothetical protein